MWKLLLVVVALLTVGCGEPPEANYQGLPLSVWTERVRSTDDAVQIDALKVIQSIGSPAKQIESVVREIARKDNKDEVKYEAIQALQAMGAPVVEFEAFIELYEGPIIPLEELKDYSDVEDMDELLDEEEMLKHASGDDDLEFLRALSEGTLEKMVRDTQTIPSDSAERAKWIEIRQNETVGEFLQYLNNPMVLREILNMGNALEREFAARKLSGMSGQDEMVIEALQEALGDSEEEVRVAAKKALEQWQLP